jgi:hypothetical protein
VRRRMGRERGSEEEDGEKGERGAVRKRMERKDEKGSEEDDYFNKFPPHYLFPSFLFSTSLPPCSPLLTTSLPPSSQSFSSLIPLHPLPHYLSPSFLSVILTTSLPPSSSSLLISLLALLFLLPLSLLPLPPTHCLSPSFLSILLLTTSPPSFLSLHFPITSLPPSSQSSSPPKEGERMTQRKEGER